MASVEELDSNLKLLTHHSSVLIKACPLSPHSRTLPKAPASTDTTVSSLIEPQPLLDDGTPPTSKETATASSTPSRSSKRPLPLHRFCSSSPTASSNTAVFDYNYDDKTPQISPTARLVGAIPPNTPTTPANSPMFSMIITASRYFGTISLISLPCDCRHVGIPVERIANLTHVLSKDMIFNTVLATGNLPGGPNVVAIDNKIEQAMDLVKTHLTFAVREEVELLRSTIVELEAKVAQLESQNQVLKQFAPAEVVANLALLVQNAQQQKQLQQLQQQAQIVTLPPVSGTSLVPPVISSAQLGQVASDELQSSVGVIPVPNTSTATDSNSNQITSTSMPSATDITTTSQLSSTLNSMAVNLSSSTSSTNTAAK
ncbi:unnamed protein product [Anisakis simplex]|uniref:Protein bunched, class 1/class 3/D/E (inferred by orthology to a D. melanogaster protein) n=1 Tax=Anisakis simplex TaxID=6269 RepID=A0A158PN51_ANISI|nr:unnamed protein product [Anisakis simplex]